VLDPNINGTDGKSPNTTAVYKTDDIHGYIIFDMAPPPNDT
jgi:hypothetical protein